MLKLGAFKNHLNYTDRKTFQIAVVSQGISWPRTALAFPYSLTVRVLEVELLKSDSM